MKTISIREMKAHWAEVEHQVQSGEVFEVLNRGRPTVRIVAASPREVLKWDDHLLTAIQVEDRSGQKAIDYDRGGRW